VRDPNTGINVSGATVVLSASKIQSGIYSSGYAEIARTTTGDNGIFGFDMEEERVVGYLMYVAKEGYFSYTVEIAPEDMPSGETYQPVYNLYPIGFIKLKAVNVAPFDTADVISYSFTSGSLECLECCSHALHYGYGMYVNDSLKCKTRGNADVAVTWNVTKNHHTVMHTGSVFCKAFDTVTYQISY
jgi:hypothetical protein